MVKNPNSRLHGTSWIPMMALTGYAQWSTKTMWVTSYSDLHFVKHFTTTFARGRHYKIRISCYRFFNTVYPSFASVWYASMVHSVS